MIKTWSMGPSGAPQFVHTTGLEFKLLGNSSCFSGLLMLRGGRLAACWGPGQRDSGCLDSDSGDGSLGKDFHTLDPQVLA